MKQRVLIVPPAKYLFRERIIPKQIMIQNFFRQFQSLQMFLKLKMILKLKIILKLKMIPKLNDDSKA